MSLDRIALFTTLAVIACWLMIMVTGMVMSLPWGLVGLLVLSVAGYLIWRVIRDRLRNSEDDYYDKNVNQ